MGNITIALPQTDDLEHFKMLGHIVFEMENLVSEEEIKKILANHLNKKAVGEPEKKEEKVKEAEETKALKTEEPKKVVKERKEKLKSVRIEEINETIEF